MDGANVKRGYHNSSFAARILLASLKLLQRAVYWNFIACEGN
jgi:hypothetical protein